MPTVKLLHKEQSKYGEVKVFEFINGSTRCAMVSGIILDCYSFTSQAADNYTIHFAEYLLENQKEIEDVLIVGIGTGSLLKMIDGADFKVTGVEINEKLPRIADKYFGLPENLDYQIVVEDGRKFLRNTDRKFDVIVMDICDVHEYSAHLWTEEFFELAKSRLKNSSSVLLAGRNTVHKNNKSEELNSLVNSAILSSFDYLSEVESKVAEAGSFDTITYLASNTPVVFAQQNLVEINKKENGVATDETIGKLVNLGSVATKALRDQTIRNYGEELLLY